MKKNICLLIVAGLLTASIVTAEIKGNVYDTVAKHGTKELMIMSRVFKNYIMIQMNNHYQDPQKKIKEKIKKFNTARQVLSTLSVDSETRVLLEEQERLWVKAEAFVCHPPQRASLEQFRKYFIPLKKNVQKLVESTRTKAARTHEESVLYAGKLFVLPQRLATFYLLQGSDPKGADKMREQMREEIKKYKEHLTKLDEISGEFSPEIQIQIKKLHKNLDYFQYLGSCVKTFVPTLAYKKTDRMSEKAKKLMFMLADG